MRPKELLRILQQVTDSKYSEEELKKFIRQLQKDDNFKIGYIEFMDRVTAIGNKEHNPLRSLMHRLAFFLEQNSIGAESLVRRLSLDGSPINVNKFAEFLKQKIEKRKSQVDLYCLAQLMDVDKDGFIGAEDLKTCLRSIAS